VRAAVRAGKVRVDGARELDPSRRMGAGAAVRLDPSAPRARPAPPLTIVF